MHPIERLRHVARAEGLDAGMLAYESAEALGDLSFDSQAIVIAARRLLDAHPECGPLWWVAARILAGDNPREASRLAAYELSADLTADELAAALPANAQLVVRPSPAIVNACVQRPDIAVNIIGSLGNDYESFRYARALPGHFSISLEELSDVGATLLVVPALAASSTGYLMSAFDAEVFAYAKSAGIETWVVTAVGRILPTALFAACVRKLGITDAPDSLKTENNATRVDAQDVFSTSKRWVTVEPVGLADLVVGPQGSFVPRPRAFRSTCPAPGELCSD